MSALDLPPALDSTPRSRADWCAAEGAAGTKIETTPVSPMTSVQIVQNIHIKCVSKMTVIRLWKSYA